MRRFLARPVPTLVLMLLLPLLVALGLWQLQRAEQKASLLAHQARQQSLLPGNLKALAEQDDPAWRAVLLQGRFDPQHTLLLDNRSRDGRAGVELLQPFEDRSSGLWVLLNRGWLPWPDRRTPPVFDTPTADADLQAWVYVPPGPAFRLQADAPDERWPRLVNVVEPPRVWQALQRDGYPYELRLLPGPAAYRADWPIVNQAPQTHRAYAVQWFALAVALIGLYLYLGFSRSREPRP